MIPAQTLLSLACLIANSGPIDTTSLEAQLTKEEYVQVEVVMASGACLPQKMELLLNETKQGVQMTSGPMVHTPSTGCF